MDLYTVVLVDDEEEVREAIVKKLDWEKIGFKLVATAANGEEALEVVENIRPDVVMTDIHMPFMDGLELCRRLKEISINTKTIIFSGYDEFEYAKEAIKLEVEEYILKPIDAKELENVFRRIGETLDKEIAQKRNAEQLEKYYQESLPIMKEQLMTSLLEGTVAESRLDELTKAYGEDAARAFMGKNYCVAVIRTEEGQASKVGMSAGLMNISIKQIVEENMKNNMESKVCIYANSVIVVVRLENTVIMPAFVNLMDQISKISARVLGVNVSTGIGQISEDAFGIAASYEGAKHALDYRILLEPNQAIYIQDVEPEEISHVYIETAEIQNIIKEIKVGTSSSLKKAIEEVIAEFKSSKINIKQLEYSFMELFVELLRLARAYGLDIEETLGKDFAPQNKMREFTSIDGLEEWLLNVCTNISDSIRKERTDSAKQLTDKAISFINENYEKCDLSVDDLCQYLNVSATYFSTIFKRNTGMGFVNYLTKVRLEKAIELLNTTSEKSYVIAGKVGYAEPNYFSYVFKKEYGISPSKYRASKVE